MTNQLFLFLLLFWQVQFDSSISFISMYVKNLWIEETQIKVILNYAVLLNNPSSQAHNIMLIKDYATSY